MDKFCPFTKDGQCDEKCIFFDEQYRRGRCKLLVACEQIIENLPDIESKVREIHDNNV